jgi:hypothetical protein
MMNNLVVQVHYGVGSGGEGVDGGGGVGGVFKHRKKKPYFQPYFPNKTTLVAM